MILYNLTLKAEWPVQSNLLEFLQAHFTQHPVAGGYELFSLESVDSTEGPTYCMHLKFPDMGTYNMHMAVNDAKMKRELQESFGDKVVYFGSVLQTVNH